MKIYVISLAAGMLVGVIYGLLQVRSPAPPLVALVGLLGILFGEQLPPLVKNVLHRQAAPVTWLREQVGPHMCGELPTARRVAQSSVPEESQS
ncbi:XapX domain-containing protein [Dyella telluris]|uniref:XapX domain-containing protein n=1 Tax=Dyella telluris TaxID=2763498 RepID=A0A7G8Q358_9GAMM|nr:XapX domain-containing protein [Dyella telluris]QNK01216.1 XapX domain-containing protein [Dyella telluris]